MDKEHEVTDGEFKPIETLLSPRGFAHAFLSAIASTCRTPENDAGHDTKCDLLTAMAAAQMEQVRAAPQTPVVDPVVCKRCNGTREVPKPEYGLTHVGPCPDCVGGCHPAEAFDTTLANATKALDGMGTERFNRDLYKFSKMTIQESLRSIANRIAGNAMLGLESKEIALSDIHDLRTLADNLDALWAASEPAPIKHPQQARDRIVIRELLVRLDIT